MEEKYFRKFKFSEEQVGKYLKNVLRDLRIAEENMTPEVKFSYSYTALLKAGIALIAGMKGLKVRSIPGHHIKILELMSDILNDKKIFAIGNAGFIIRFAELFIEKSRMNFLSSLQL